MSRLKFQGTHCSLTDKRQSIHCIYHFGLQMIGFHPFLEDHISPMVRQRICYELRQTCIKFFSVSRHRESSLDINRIQRCYQWSNIPSILHKILIELENRAAPLVIPRQQAHILIPQIHLHNIIFHVLPFPSFHSFSSLG